MRTEAPTRLLPPKVVAAKLDLHVSTVRRMIRDGRLAAVQLGGRGTSVRVDEAELDRWLRS